MIFLFIWQNLTSSLIHVYDSMDLNIPNLRTNWDDKLGIPTQLQDKLEYIAHYKRALYKNRSRKDDLAHLLLIIKAYKVKILVNPNYTP